MTNSEYFDPCEIQLSKTDQLEIAKKGVPGLDGPWSDTSKYIARLYQVDMGRLEMDSNWVLTPEHWTCPSCERTKARLARFDEANGIVLCKLHEHHDHFVDYAERRLKNELRRDGLNPKFLSDREKSRESSLGVLLDNILPMIVSFPRTIICETCNAFEVTLKKASDLNFKEFSFSAGDIKACLALDQDATYINKPILDQISIESKKHLESRKRVLEFLIIELRENRSWYLRSYGQSRSEIAASATYMLTRHGLWLVRQEEYARIHASRPRPKKSDSRAWRTKKRESIPAPSPEIVSKLSGSPFWDYVPDDWSCPVCRRSKFDQIRNSPKLDHTILPKDIWVEIDGTRQKKHICRECHYVRARLAQEAAIQVNQVPLEIVGRAIKDARAHSSHLVADHGTIDELVIELEEACNEWIAIEDDSDDPINI